MRFVYTHNRLREMPRAIEKVCSSIAQVRPTTTTTTSTIQRVASVQLDLAAAHISCVKRIKYARVQHILAVVMDLFFFSILRFEKVTCSDDQAVIVTDLMHLVRSNTLSVGDL